MFDIRNFESYDIPILYLNGSIAGMTKDNKVTLEYIWKERSGTCTLKWQGNSSIMQFQKRNYTIKFDNAFEAVSGWGVQDKYCLKSNFNDPSQYRNLLCATLWGKIVKSRTTPNANLNTLPNGGAVDGFPVVVALNGEFHGLYTWNIPKDAWTFGMTGTTQTQAIVCADVTGDSTGFKELVTFTNDFELEYSSDGQSEWVLDSVNRLIGAVKDSDGTNIQYGITPYIDWDSAIDYFIHTVLTKGTDAINKNYIMVTFDGVKWIFSAYDMDTTFGVTDYGNAFTTANGTPTFASMASSHKLFELIWKYMRPQLRARYKVIREKIVNEIQVSYLCYNFTAKIPLLVANADVLKHNRIASSGASNIEQILTYLRLRLSEVDKWIESTDGETELPEQVNPSAPILKSISATYSGGNVAVGTALTDLTGIIVTGTYSDGSTSNITGYTLSGNITEGTNTITVAYEGLTTTFAVTGVVEVIYINQVPISTDTDGSIYNSTGYKNGYRVRSSGSETTGTNQVCTGFIPAKAGDVIRAYSPKSSAFGTEIDSGFTIYDSSKTCLGQLVRNGAYNAYLNGGYTWAKDVTKIDSIVTHTIPTTDGFADVAFVRVTVGFDTLSHATGEGLIVTVNQEIS